MNARRRGGGFTLIELVVAVAVFAIVATVVYARAGDVLNQAGRLEARTLAIWVAQNSLAALQIAPRQEGEALPSGHRTEQTRLGGRDWRVEITFAETSLPTFKRVDVQVYPAESGQAAAAGGGADGSAGADAAADAAPGAAARLTGFVGAEP